MRKPQSYWPLSLLLALTLFGPFTSFCCAQCWNNNNPQGDGTISFSPNFWAPGQTYNVVATSSEGNFLPGTLNPPQAPSIITSAAYYAFEQTGSWPPEDPNITVTNNAYISATQVSFTVTVAAGAPTEEDAYLVYCGAALGGVTTSPGTPSITPCAIPVTPTITSVSPSALFAGQPTNITINGSGFVNDPNSCGISSLAIYTATEDLTITNETIVSPSQITLTVTSQASDPAEAVTVEVSNVNLNGPPPWISALTTASILPVPVIQWNGNTISGSGTSAQSAVVGQQIQLSTTPTAATLAAIPTPVTISQITWSVGGTNIGGYTPTPTSFSTGSVTPTTTTATTYQNLNTYWVYPSTKGTPFQVAYQYCYTDPVAGIQCSPNATAKFNVTGPTGGTMTFTPYSAAVSIANLTACSTAPGGPYLIYAENATGSICNLAVSATGITYNSPTGYQNASGGTFSLIQLISSDTLSGAGTSFGAGLDTRYPDPGPPNNDNPAIALPSTPTTVSRNFTANLFLMWKSSITNSIPVPLGYQTWGFNGSATCSESCGTYTNWEATTIGTPGPEPVKNGFKQSTASQTQVGNNILVDGYPTWTAISY
jgi:hypothetical protein